MACWSIVPSDQVFRVVALVRVGLLAGSSAVLFSVNREVLHQMGQMEVQEHEFGRNGNPVDAVEQFADFKKWSFERATEDEIAIMVQGIWTDYSVSFSWMANFEALHIASAFDMRIPESRSVETMRLLSLINEQMLFGHFDLWLSDGSVMYRHAVPLAGGAEANEAQIECLLQNALTCCERYYQAFQFVVWAGKSATDALDSVLFDTVGEA